jgi:regulator of replication initiation timing
MISEFQELSDKIDQLAEMVQALRRENAQLRADNAQLRGDNEHLRQGNAGLVAQAIDYHGRMNEATARVEALLQKISPHDGTAEDPPEHEDVR